MAKTIVLRNKHVTQRPVIVEGSEIEEVQSNIYLGQRVSLVDTDMGNEINRRIQAGSESSNDHKIFLKSNIPNSLKKKLYNQCVLPAMTYASETWTITKALERRLTAPQRNLEKAMIGVSCQDHRTNEWIRRKTKFSDIMHFIKARKWTWAGHIARLQGNRWTSQVTDP